MRGARLQEMLARKSSFGEENMIFCDLFDEIFQAKMYMTSSKNFQKKNCSSIGCLIPFPNAMGQKRLKYSIFYESTVVY